MTRLPTPTDLRRLHARRASLEASGTTLYRAAHTTETGGLFSLERAGAAGILSLYAPLSSTDELALAARCGEALSLGAVFLKRRPQEARHAANVQREELSPPLPVWGEGHAELVAHEAGVPYLIRPGSDLSTGLFSDARPARAWVRAQARGRVLNAFAYTCGFGVSARLGDAQVVKNLDLSRKVLAWGQENYALSGLDAPATDFIYGDVFEWLGLEKPGRLARRGDTFDTIILDPPSFARSRLGVWRSERDYGRLAAAARGLLAPGGRVLALCNHAGMRSSAFQRLLEAGGLRPHARFGAGDDYPGATHLQVVVAAPI